MDSNSYSMQSVIDVPLNLINFGYSNIMEYCEKMSALLENAGKLFEENKKGALMYKDRFVSGITFRQKQSGEFFISAKVKAEMKMKIIYDVSVLISSTNEILSTTCTCPGGASPATCKHVFAFLCGLEDYSRQELYSAPTEKLQLWHQPQPYRKSPKKCSDLFYETPRKISCKGNFNFDALKCLPANTLFFSVLEKSQSLFEKFSFPLPALVLSENSILSFSQKNLPLEHILFLHKNLTFDIKKIWELESSTVKQSECDLWRKERLIRVTSSNFYDIWIRKTNFDALAERIYNSHFENKSHVPSIAFGIQYEAAGRNFIRNECNKGIVRKVGCVTNPFYPFLSASPDGLSFSVNTTEIIEIKCLFNPQRLDLEQLSKRADFCLQKTNNGWKLKPNHRYYHQIQGQLALTNLNACKFVLLYKVPKEFYSETIYFNKEHWEEVKIKLSDFYFNHYLPLLISKNV